MVQRDRLLDFFPILLALIICLGGMAFWGSPAYAFLSTNRDKRGKDLTGNSVQSRGNTQRVSPQELQKDEAWKSFLSQHGEGWKVLRNQAANYLRVDNTDLSDKLSGKPSGKASRNLVNETDFVEESKKFIQENGSIFKVAPQNFRLEKVDQRGGVWYVRFKQYVQDIPVYGSNLTLRYQASGKLLSFGGNIYQGITLDLQSSQGASQGASQAAVDSQTALRIAAENLGVSPDSLTSHETRLVVYPYQGQDNQSASYRLCWELELTSGQQARRGWRYFIDAQDGTILEGYDRARYAISGKIQGQIFPEYPPLTITAPLPNLKVMILDKTTPLMYESLDRNPGGWTGTSLFSWEYGIPVSSVNGMGPDPDSAHTGSNVYGYNLQGSYPSNLPNREYLTTPQISRIGTGGKNTVLRFWRWLGVEGSDLDRVNIEVNDFPGTWREIWSNPKESIYDGDWKLVSYDLSDFLTASKNTLLIRWGLGPTNSSYNYCGWNLDDIGVYNGIQGVTNENGNFTVTDEAQNNILDVNLKGVYFQVKNMQGDGLVYTNGNVNRNNTNINITLKPASDYNSQTDSGVISPSTDIDELNAYYHANRLVEYIQTIDPNFPGRRASFFPVSVTVHNTAESTNSYWLEGDGIYFGEGNKFEYQDFAQYSDVIYHEVTHAVTDSIYESKPQSNPNRFTQFDAMHEAFSDYWACTINDDSQIAEGGFWSRGALRDLENDLHYRLNYGDELYESSLILSGAMWKLRQELRSKYGEKGIKLADTLFLFATYPEPVSYLDFLLDVLAVDEAKYNRANKDLIIDSFGRKGIAESPTVPASILVSVDRDTVKLSWERVTDASGYNLYYDVSAIRAVQSTSRYTPGGTSGSTSGGTPGGDGGTGDDGTMDGSTSGGTGGTNTGSSNITKNLKNKVDLGNVTTYNLGNLQSNTTYRILLTAYNEYDIESSPSQDIYATPVDPNSAKINYILVPGPSESSSKKTCFIAAIGSWFGYR